jgi:predicted Abi (CAAX) family protease
VRVDPAGLARAQRVSAVLLAILSVAVSVVMLAVGVPMALETGAPWSVRGFGLLVVVYVGWHALALIGAWRDGAPTHELRAARLGLTFFGAALVSTVDTGSIPDAAWLGLSILAALLFTQWLAVRRGAAACRRQQAAGAR